VPEGQIIDSLTVITGQVLIERHVFLPFNGEVVSGRCDVLLPVEEKVRLAIFHEVKYFLKIAAHLNYKKWKILTEIKSAENSTGRLNLQEKSLSRE
jgi:hypothetical protein